MIKNTFKDGLNSDKLKLIAIIAMTIDHLTWAFFPGYNTEWYVIGLHIIGRLTAPIMWFFIAEGAFHTKNIKKYAARLFAFAFISHFAYCFAFGIPLFSPSAGILNRTGIMLPLALSVTLIAICRNPSVPALLQYIAVFTACILALPADWSSIAVMAPFFLYHNRSNIKKQGYIIVFWTAIYALVYFFFIDRLYAVLQMFTFLSIPLISKYNGKRGPSKGSKWFFYIYYPLHLLIVGIIRIMLHGDFPLIP